METLKSILHRSTSGGHPQDGADSHHQSQLLPSQQSHYNSNNHTTLSSTSTFLLNGHGQAKQPTPAKKSFQNLGLHSGAASGNLGLVKFALDHGQPIDSVVNGVLAIHAACCSNANIAVVLFLLEQGADVNARRWPRKYSGEKNKGGAQTVGTTGSTPLHFAAANGCLAVVEILLRHGAIVDMTDKYGSSPLSVATARNHLEVANLLHQHSTMQRGVFDLTPDREISDPFTSPRSSGDFGNAQRMPMFVSPVRTGHLKDTSSKSLPIPATASPSATPASSSPSSSPSTKPAQPSARNSSQRRISLPSIVESPHLPIYPAAPPRQSCDFGRVPISMASLSSHPDAAAAMARTESEPAPRSSMGDVENTALPQRGQRTNQYTTPTRMIRTRSGNRDQSSGEIRPASATQAARGEQLMHPSAGEATPAAAPRRKSLDSRAFLSPEVANTISRRRSLDHLRADADAKPRRPSDASSLTAGSTGSDTGYSSNSSVSLPGSKRVLVDRKLETIPSDLGVSSVSTTSAHGSTDIMPIQMDPSDSALTESRAPIGLRAKSMDASDPAFQINTGDLMMMTANEEPGSSFGPGHLLRNHTSPTLERSMSGDLEIAHSRSGQRYRPEKRHSMPIPLIVADQTPPRRSMGGLPSPAATGFNNTATVSGRLSQIWGSGANNQMQKDGTSSNWNVGGFAEESGESAAQGLVKGANANRSRHGVLSRLSGLWSRR